MERMILKTMSRSGIPNINKVVYSKEEFDKMIKNLDGNQVKLTKGSFCNKNYMEDCQDLKTFKALNLDILGDVVEIRDGEITVDVYDDKLDILKDAIDKGYKPGMRYFGEVSKRDNNNIATATDIKLICYDMVTDKDV